MAALPTNLEYFIKRGDPQQCLLKLIEQVCCSSYKYLEVVSWRQLQFTSNRKVDRTVCEVSSGNDAICLLLECRKSQSFSREKATLKRFWMKTFCSMEDELTWKVLWNGAMEGQLLLQDRSISRTWRSGQKTLNMWANCVLKHCFSLETFISKFVAFFVPLGIVIFCNCNNLCIRKMSFLGSFGKTEFTAAVVSLSTSQEVDNVH